MVKDLSCFENLPYSQFDSILPKAKPNKKKTTFTHNGNRVFRSITLGAGCVGDDGGMHRGSVQVPSQDGLPQWGFHAGAFRDSDTGAAGGSSS